MRLRAKVVDLVGLHLLQNAREVGTVGEVAVMQNETLLIHMRVFVDMVYALRVE